MKKNVVKFEQIPKNILGFLVNIEDTTYYIVNNTLCDYEKRFILEALNYYKDRDIAKITITDIHKHSNAIKYAESRGYKLNDYERIYKYS